MIEALTARVNGDEALVSRFRSSHHFAAFLFFGIESTGQSLFSGGAFGSEVRMTELAAAMMRNSEPPRWSGVDDS
jgi:hypothetical protein